MTSTQEILKNARAARVQMRGIDEDKINTALMNIADELILGTPHILDANRKDCENARGKISEVMIDRLRLSEERITAMASGIREIAALPCPLGRVLSETVRPNGLNIKKVSVPIGVIAIIYESRPGVTSDAAALAIKSGNVCILRGGKEAYLSARAITDCIVKGITAAGLPAHAVQLVSDTTRESATELMRARGFVDMLIPRGGAGLIRACVENSQVPVLETGTGICHVYVDRDADLDMALKIVENAKTSRPSVCNAAEALLVHSDIAGEFLPRLKSLIVDKRNEAGLAPVELRLDTRAREIIEGKEATDADFDTEFLDYVLAVKVVNSVKEAADHIEAHSTHHSECIVTENEMAVAYFTSAVDSAAVYVNASTRFTDGGEFGLGCEMGISTQRLHARGPLGICELTTYKYLIEGNGQIRG